MATIRILLGIVWIVVIGSSWRVNRNTIDDGFTHQTPNDGRFGYVDQRREKVVAFAQNEVGVQEYSENSSSWVDQYNFHTPTF